MLEDEGRTKQVLSRHWDWRPEWTAKHRVWWWYATFESAAAVRRLAEQARAALAPDAPVDVVPTRWLHLTLAEVGGSAVVPRALAYAAARAAASSVSELAPLDVRIGPTGTMPGAV